MKRKLLMTIMAVTLASVLAAGCSSTKVTDTPKGNESSGKETTEAAKGAEEGTKDSTDTSKGNEQKEEELKDVNLVMYVLGDKPKDFDLVFDEVNKLSKNDLKATIETKFISWADFSTKYPLVFASGEKFDLIYTSNWSYYAQQAVKNGFLELTDELLKQYAPNCFAKIPKEAWDQARIKGKIYMIPNTQEEYNHLGYLIRGDLREKYGLSEINTLADFEKYLETVAQNEKGIIPFDGGSDFDSWTIPTIALMQPKALSGIGDIPGYAFSLTDPKAEPIKMAENSDFISYIKKMREWNQKGFWSKNALNNKIAVKDSFLNGKSASALHNLGTMAGAWKTVMQNHPEWKPEVYDTMENFPTLRTSYLGNGMGIHATADNPERALMFIDKVRFDQKYYDMVMYGIEGVHWKNIGDKKIESTPEAANYGGYSNWGFNTEESQRKGTDGWPKFESVYEIWRGRLIQQPVAYMAFENGNVKNEVAAMTNLSRKYSKMLDYGFASNPEKLLAEYEKQLDAAGRQKVLDEWKKQKDEYLKNFGY